MFSQHELAPKEDQGVVFGIVQAAPNATIDQTTRFTEKVNDVFESMPETEHTFQITDPSGGFSGMVTKPWSQRKRSTEQILADVRETWQYSGVRIIPTTPPPLPGGGNFPVEFVIASTAEPQELLEFANQLVAKAFQSGIFMFADTDLKFDQPQTEVVFDRDKVASLGLNLQQVGLDLGTMLGGDYVNRFSIEGRSYKVIPQVTRVQRLNADQLKDFYVSGPNGKLVQLSTFATLKNTTEPRAIYRFQQLNSVKVQGALALRRDARSRVESARTRGREDPPRGYTIDYAGEARQLRVEGNNLNSTLILSFILIFLVLAAQFESFRDPFIILLGSVPLALSGSLLFAFLGFTTLNIYSQIGLITLVGLVSKNGILIVEFANTLQEAGVAKLHAVIEAAGTRLRPILMTSVATIAGHFPLVLARGPGAGSRNSIGTVLVTGMGVGTLFTLFVVPAIYMLVARNRAASAKRVETEEEIAESELEHAAGVASLRGDVLGKQR